MKTLIPTSSSYSYISDAFEVLVSAGYAPDYEGKTVYI